VLVSLSHEPAEDQNAVMRMASSDADTLFEVLFRRYPEFEWATFARFGWRDTPSGLVLSLAALDPSRSGSGDLDERVGHVAISEAYSLRTALAAADHHTLAVGVIHSHPDNCWTSPSSIDDEMDRYYGSYFSDFAPGRPYASLIFSRRGGNLFGTGRVLWKGSWLRVRKFAALPRMIMVDAYSGSCAPEERQRRRRGEGNHG
jgi:hypothetical protein